LTSAADHAQFAERIGAKCDDRMTVGASCRSFNAARAADAVFWAHVRSRPEEEKDLNDGPRRPVGALLSHPAGSLFLKPNQKAAAAPASPFAD
jgi:hypothetical protein